MGAGAIGGFISAFFKLGWEVPFPPRAPDRIPEPAVLITMFTHVPTSDIEGWIVHFTFSISSGIAYGALVEFFPIVAIGMGVGFGIAIWIGAHLFVMPWMGLTPPAWKLPFSEDLSEFFGHAVWGFVIEVFPTRFPPPVHQSRTSGVAGAAARRSARRSASSDFRLADHGEKRRGEPYGKPSRSGCLGRTSERAITYALAA
jgi:putative membrane protein